MKKFPSATPALTIALLYIAGTLLVIAEPLGTGRARFFGCVYAPSHGQGFTEYWNQITPGNAGKWRSVENTRDVMNWSDLDDAYHLAKLNGLPFHYHVLIWGNQQPTWIESLSPAEQREEIEEWFAAVAERYPDIDYLEVVNEPLHDAPDSVGSGNYINALGGTGASGWEWVLESFRLARTYFPGTQLMLNDYAIIGNTANTTAYLNIVALLQAEDLIDIIGFQAHSFSTTGSSATMATNLDSLAATGLPIQVMEMDVDGPTDAQQLSEYQRILPIFWEHPDVMGITLWGFRPGMWRTAQMAYLIEADGTERPAMTWLRSYLAEDESPLSFVAYASGEGLLANERTPAGDSDADSLATGFEYLLDTSAVTPNESTLAWSMEGGAIHMGFQVSPLVSEGTLTIASNSNLASGGWSVDASHDWSTGMSSNLAFTGLGAGVYMPFDSDTGDFVVSNGTITHTAAEGDGAVRFVNVDGHRSNVASIRVVNNAVFLAELEQAVANTGTLSFDVTILAADYDPTDAPDPFALLLSANTSVDGYGTAVVVDPGFDFANLQAESAQTRRVTVDLAVFNSFTDIPNSTWVNVHFGSKVEAGLIGNGNVAGDVVTYYIDNISIDAVPRIDFSQAISPTAASRFFRIGYEIQ